MEAFVKRMVDEHTDLIGKIKRLRKFINDTDPQSKFKTLSEEEQKLDKEQLEAMINYANILERRIEIHYPEFGKAIEHLDRL